MQLLWGHDDTVWRWACRFFDGGLCRSTWAVGIIDRRGVLRGALLGDEVNAWTVEVTICAEQAISNDTAKAFFQAVFSRYWRLQVSTTKDNKSIKQNAPKWGCTFEGTAKGYYGPGRDALRYRMTAAECRWLHPRQKAIINGQLIRIEGEGKAGGRHRGRANAAKPELCRAAADRQSLPAD